jgi:hypothetical protein
MCRQVIFGLVAVLAVSVSSAGCWKKSGQAIVLEKEHIAAAEVTPTPTAEESASPGGSTPSPSESPPEEVEYKTHVLAEDEIEVGSYVMKKEVRGTSRDPRARPDEQWIVRVQLVDDLSRVNIQTDQLQYDKVKVGDRIKISYRQGKYTGTVWAAEID